MADESALKWKSLAEQHQNAAAAHEAAAHHHREAGFALSTGNKIAARQHGLAAAEHAAQAGPLSQGSVESPGDYDLDVRFDKMTDSSLGPMITSWSLCTPGCGNTGTGNSFCCGLGL
jgi:gallidermin/nisin family lantibiotic